MQPRISVPLYKIGDVVYYRGFLGFIVQGVVRAATYGLIDDEWTYYVSSRPNSWKVSRKEILGKA